MRLSLIALLLIVAGAALTGCDHIGESTAPKPDPKMFLPKDKNSAGGPPPSHPSAAK